MIATTIPATPTSHVRRRLCSVALIGVTALAPIVWGTTYVVTTEMLPPDHPVYAALLRSLPMGVVGVVLTRALPGGDWWWKAAVLGVLNIGAFLPLLFIAAERLPGGVAATLGAAQPLVVAGLAVVILGEQLSTWRIVCGIAGTAGVGLVVLGRDAAFDWVGVIAGLGSAGVMAFGVTLTKRWGRPPGVGPMSLAAWQLTAGGLVLLPLALLVEGAPPRINPTGAAGYLWLGTAGGLIAYALWFRGIGRLPVTATAMLGLLSPLMAAVLGAVLLGEVLADAQLVGFVLALAALVASQFALPARAQLTHEWLPLKKMRDSPGP